MKHLLTILLATLTLQAVAQNTEQAQRRPRFHFDTEHPDVHDPVMAKGEDGRFYIFSTGMGISCMSSSDLKTWQPEKSVLNPIPQWATDSIRGYRGHTWAPDISYHDGKWLMYYSCSTFGKNGSAIGLATNKTLNPQSADFHWEDQGAVIVSHQHQDNYNCIDPNLIVDGKGTPWLTFGSFWDGIQIVKLKKDFKTVASKPKTISRRIGRKITLAEIDNIEHYTIDGGDTIEAGENAVEAPFIIKNGKYYYLFVSFDFCCRGERSTYRTVVGRSKKVNGPYMDRKGIAMEKGGGETLIGPNESFFGVGHNSAYQVDGQWYFLSHAYEKAYNGQAKVFLRKMYFDHDGWPLLE
ncbi:MAG: arabinan endo-1,5-alpha-L-arabinosidase [Bacteroidales bacterium]|nr:arabinan endo-1,5-alpha-L-arabinosidase [Bacteroidales bacterium]